jgi:hypothetical protein
VMCGRRWSAPSVATAKSLLAEEDAVLHSAIEKAVYGRGERIWELLERCHAREQEHDLGPARRLLTQALEAASAADMPEVVCISRQLLGIVAHKADRLDEAGAHLNAALTLALDAGARTDEAYSRQELGFLLLDTEIRSWP